MRTLLIFLLSALTAWTAPQLTGPKTVMVDTNGTLTAPTNFFAANSNALNASVLLVATGPSTNYVIGVSNGVITYIGTVITTTSNGLVTYNVGESNAIIAYLNTSSNNLRTVITSTTNGLVTLLNADIAATSNGLYTIIGSSAGVSTNYVAGVSNAIIALQQALGLAVTNYAFGLGSGWTNSDTILSNALNLRLTSVSNAAVLASGLSSTNSEVVLSNAFNTRVTSISNASVLAAGAASTNAIITASNGLSARIGSGNFIANTNGDSYGKLTMHGPLLLSDALTNLTSRAMQELSFRNDLEAAPGAVGLAQIYAVQNSELFADDVAGRQFPLTGHWYVEQTNGIANGITDNGNFTMSGYASSVNDLTGNAGNNYFLMDSISAETFSKIVFSLTEIPYAGIIGNTDAQGLEYLANGGHYFYGADSSTAATFQTAINFVSDSIHFVHFTNSDNATFTYAGEVTGEAFTNSREAAVNFEAPASGYGVLGFTMGTADFGEEVANVHTRANLIWDYNNFLQFNSVSGGFGFATTNLQAGTGNTDFVIDANGVHSWNSIDVVNGSFKGNGAGLTNLSTLTNGIITLRSNAAPPFAITIGASPTGWTNKIGCNAVVYIDGVSVTGTVAVNGGTIFNTIGQCTVMLQTNDVVIMTYTIGTPAAKWRPF